MDIDLEGIALLTDPLLNKGSAFTEEERTSFHLHGLLPPHVGTLDEQSDRRLKALRKFETNLERYLFLRGLQDCNETLFYVLLTRHLAELLPLVYTPTVGEGCQEFSHSASLQRRRIGARPLSAGDVLAWASLQPASVCLVRANARGTRLYRRRALSLSRQHL